MFEKPGIVDNMPEGVFADFALSNAGMTINPGPESGFRIIEMKSQHLFDSNRAIHLVDQAIPNPGLTEIVSRRKTMGGVQTNAESLRSIDPREDLGQVSDLMPQTGALARRVLQRDAHR